MRTYVFKLVVVCFLIACPVIAYSQREIRIRENFDFDWKFLLSSSVDASSKTYDDLTWEKVQLPHDWSIRMPLNRRNGGSMGFLPGGIGWYRKTFNIPGNYKGKKIYINFDGVYHQSDVYINGKHLGFHPYGYTGFEYDLTPYLNFGGENTIAVKVDHSNSPSSRWYSGSGIYRHVWLKVTDPVHAANWGTYITTPEVTEEVAGIKIVTTIENNTDKSEKIEVQNRIIDADGKEVASEKISTQIVEGKSGNADQLINLKQPNLWSVETPYLYSMETIIRVKGKVVDSFKTPFGIRYFKFDADEGFFLNGKNIKLKGVNLHPDAGSLGTAVPDRSYLRRLKILKEYGCNAIRCSHNPPSPEFLDMCDSLGFVVIDEAFDKWKSGYYAKYFDEYWMKDLDAMLLRDRNHPSIVLWSTGNETTEQNDTTGTGTERAGMLQDYVRKAEPTRPVTVVISPSNVIQRPYHKNGFTEVFNIVGYNYVEPMLQEYRKNFPESIMYIAEAFPYYSGRKDYIRDYNPTNPWYTVANNDFVFGQFIWAGVDYLGETSGWPSTGWPTGLFDVCMFEKPRAAFHRSVWNETPMVRIAVADQSLDIDPGKDHWSWPHLAAHWNFPQYRGHIIEVQTVTNCESVGLWVNEKWMGQRNRSDYSNNTIVWHVPYAAGKIYAKAYNGNEELAQFELLTSGEPAKIVLSADRESINADGQDLSHITIQIVDDKGVVVPGDDRIINIEVSGSGSIKGLDNGDLRRTGSYELNNIKTYFGKALATVQSLRSQGNINIRVNCEGLPESTLQIFSSLE